jgi:hypothetical protein
MTSHYPTAKAITFKSNVLLTAANLDVAITGMLRTALRTAPPLQGDIMVVTSATDGTHKEGSLHYVSCAFDIRYTGDRLGGIVADDLSAQTTAAGEWVARMKQQLGPDYDVVAEATHIHVEWDPK